MMLKPEGKERFLKAVMRMPGVWLCLFAMLVAMVLAVWFNFTFRGTSIEDMIFPTLYAGVVGTFVIVHLAYRVYTGKTPITQNRRQAQSVALRESVAGIPLILGLVGTFYLIVTNQLNHLGSYSPQLAALGILRVFGILIPRSLLRGSSFLSRRLLYPA